MVRKETFKMSQTSTEELQRLVARGGKWKVRAMNELAKRK